MSLVWFQGLFCFIKLVGHQSLSLHCLSLCKTDIVSYINASYNSSVKTSGLEFLCECGKGLIIQFPQQIYSYSYFVSFSYLVGQCQVMCISQVICPSFFSLLHSAVKSPSGKWFFLIFCFSNLDFSFLFFSTQFPVLCYDSLSVHLLLAEFPLSQQIYLPYLL